MSMVTVAYPATLTRDNEGRYLVRFRDLPEALTDGANENEALEEAADCLSEALMSRIVDNEDIPTPSVSRRGEYTVAPDATVALKVSLCSIVRSSKLTTAELARRLGIDHKEARRFLDPRHLTKFPRLLEALAVLGYETRIALHDTSRRERMLKAPGETRRSTLRPKQFVEIGRR